MKTGSVQNCRKYQKATSIATEVNEIRILGEVAVNLEQSVRNLEMVTEITKPLQTHKFRG